MRLRISVNCPDDEVLIERIIDAASEGGAGGVGNYSGVAFILRGQETWKTEEGAHPYIGEVGKVSIQPSAKIEMQCSSEKLKEVYQAIKTVHPYEEPVIEVTKLEEINF